MKRLVLAYFYAGVTAMMILGYVKAIPELTKNQIYTDASYEKANYSAGTIYPAKSHQTNNGGALAVYALLTLLGGALSVFYFIALSDKDRGEI